MIRPRRAALALGALVASLGVAVPAALAAFPYARPGADTTDFADLYLAREVPADICGDDNEWKYSASPDPANTVTNSEPTELGGVRGGHLVDKQPAGEDCSEPPLHASSRPTAWKRTTGRPDVTIAVLDSGIKWNDEGAMGDLRRKVRLNTAELPTPEGCASHDCDGDGVVTVDDWAGDPRVDLSDPRRVGPPGVLVPQDLLLAFSDGSDADGNGYVDDIAGWDFLDDDNDAFDDVQYGHGTGEATDSVAEADNGRVAGSCPNCMFVPLRVGDSFIADVNRFAAAVLYATDNGVEVVQEALGTINNTRFARRAVDYAYRHGVTVIASAADEAAQHNNWPSSLPHVILVNSVTQGIVPPPRQSYLAFNGCTNFNSKITLAIPSDSCSSNATGVGAGMAGIVYSAALTAAERGVLEPHPGPGCVRTSGEPCPVTPNEVRQLMASGTIAGTPQADDVSFAGTPPGSGIEPSCTPPAPRCTDPNVALQAQVDANRPVPLPASRSYPARAGHDQFYGWGRVNMYRATRALLSSPRDPVASKVPPEAEITSPEWYSQVNPARDRLVVEGEVFARGARYTCEVLVAPGQYPNNARVGDVPPGDFERVGGAGWCNGSGRSERHSGPLATIDLERLRARFPAATDFRGPEPVPTAANGNGRPNAAPHSFTIRLEVHARRAGTAMTGEDRRALYLHRDRDMLPGFPRQATPGGTTGDGESSPALADLDGDNRNELVYATSDGYVHALRPDGSELPGWPVRGRVPGFVAGHSAARAYASGEVPSRDLGGAMLAAVAVGDTDGDGVPEVYAADLEGMVYGWSPAGRRIFTEQSNPDWSGAPLAPFENVRYEPGQSEFRRTQHGFIGSPVLADLDADGDQEIVAAAMDRHVYAWDSADADRRRPGGADPVAGFPVLVVDLAKVADVDPVTHAVTFGEDAGSRQQGAIIVTPAVADLTGDERPEIVVGTNEEYEEELNAGNITTALFSVLDELGSLADALDLLSFGNSRVHAIAAQGDADGDPMTADWSLPGWPFAAGILNTELLPVVGEGITGSPVVATLDCPSGGAGPKVGVMANNGPAYLLNADATPCHGNDPTSGRPNALEADLSVSALQFDRPAIPALGHPAFGDLGGAQAAFLSPAAGALRALDVAVPEYQPSQDFVAAWETASGQFRPNFPVTMNDLQFLTGPSVADLDGLPGEEVVAGSASMDLAAYSALGLPVPGWPKLSTDWTVANPLIGSFGSRDTDPGARKAVFGFTRSGSINAYATGAPACSPASWPRFHHDNANSGDYGRDAVAPGTPYGGGVRDGALVFRAPGDDLLCGSAAAYEAVTSNEPISERNFARKQALAGLGDPAAAGALERYALPAAARRYVAIRARDEQGNVGRPLGFDLGG